VSDYTEAMTWINLSQRDHDIAFHLEETFTPLPVETICFHSQQAVEKALKAVLAYYEVNIEYTHNIRTLAELCKVHTDVIFIDDKVVDRITAFAVITRYIEDRHDYTEDTSKFALNQANLALEAVKQFLKESRAEADEKNQQKKNYPNN